MKNSNSFGTKNILKTDEGECAIFSLRKLQEQGLGNIDRLPFSMRVLLENLLRNEDGYHVTKMDVKKVIDWKKFIGQGVAFFPARVILQDFTGVPCMVDFAAMRDALKRLGGDPKKINPVVPADLVIDHSVQVDYYGSPNAFQLNRSLDFKRNGERYGFLKWAQKSLSGFHVVPPGVGIVHQVNLEHLARIVQKQDIDGAPVIFPDTLIGTDSHTTMINGVGVFGFGVGGIEAEAVMLGQPYDIPIPEVVGVRLCGEIPKGATATDLVLTITEILRSEGVVGKIVEYFGPGLEGLTVPDRATLANMAPEYGATMGFFPVDTQTLDYLRFTGRSELIGRVESYCREQLLFHGRQDEPDFSKTLELNLNVVRPSMAGPKRPQDRIFLSKIKPSFAKTLEEFGVNTDEIEKKELTASAPKGFELCHGSVVIAAITSCTNTSNPAVMLAAGLVAKKAIEKGLVVKPWVKTSLAPGSRVVVDYLKASGLLPYLEKANFYLAGYGCTTCIGNSGPLSEPVASAIEKGDLIVASVLSGNRNFEGRIHPLSRTNYLASPPLVVLFAFAGKIDIDLEKEPVGFSSEGRAVYFKDLWPSASEISEALTSLSPKMFTKRYASVFQGEDEWEALAANTSELYPWDESSYIQDPPFFKDLTIELNEPTGIAKARVLALLGDSVTTDHISPAGSIPVDLPAGKYLIENGVKPADFNSYGSRRGNHNVMMRGTFANIRIKNLLAPGTEGGVTVKLPEKIQMSIYEAAMLYRQQRIPTIIIAGKEYGTGSSRDWAAKGTALLGVKAVLVESYERIHHSNLVGMGILPLQFEKGQGHRSMGISGEEIFDISLPKDLTPKSSARVTAIKPDGDKIEFDALVRLDTEVEIDYYRQGGILQAVLRKFLLNG